MKSLLLTCSVLFSGLHLTKTHPETPGRPNDGWIFKHETDHIKVWYRPDTSGAMHSVRAATSFHCTQAAIVALLDDCARIKTWGYKTSESRPCRRVSDTETYYYARYDVPWPLTDRDIVMHSIRWQDTKTGCVRYAINAAPDEIPEQKDLVRIRNAYSNWQIFPTRDGWTYCEWIVSSDPGGKIPAWLVNMAVTRGPYESMKGIRRVLSRH